MGYPLAALSVRPLEQQPGAVDQLARVMQLKGLMQRQELGQQQIQSAQLANQGNQLNLKSQQAMMQAVANGDLNKYFGEEKPGQPGGFDAAGAYQHLLFSGVVPGVASQFVNGYQGIIAKNAETAKNMGAAAADYVKNRSASLDEISQRLADIKGLPAEQQGAALNLLKQTYAANPPPGIGKDEIAAFQQADPSHLDYVSGILGIDQKMTDYQAKLLSARSQAATQSAEASQKTRLALPPTPDQLGSALNAIGTYSAIPQNMRQAFAQQMHNAPDYQTLQDVQKRADAAQESFQRSADARANAMAMRDIGLQEVVAGKLVQQDQNLSTTLASSQGIRSLLDMTKGGNQMATGAAITRFAEHEVKEGGINRFNETELNAIGGGSTSWMRRAQTWYERGAQGAPPTATNSEINEILNAEDQIARQQHDQNVNDITNRYSTVANVRRGSTQTQTNQTPATKGTISLANIQRAAKEHGISVDEAKKQAQAAGYTIQ